MIAMETLNMIPQLRNPTAKLSDENPGSLSRPADHATGFDKLLRQDVSSDEMHEDKEDNDAIENPETGDQEENKAISMPLQMGIGNTVLAHTVFSQQIQKTDKLLKAEISGMTGDGDSASFPDMRRMGAKDEIPMAGRNRPLFAIDADNSAAEQELQQDVSGLVHEDTQSGNGIAGENDAANGRHNRPAVMHTLSSDTAFGKTDIAKPLEIGDRIQLKADSAAVSQQGRIEGLEVVQSKKSGDLRILHLKLLPENLGGVEARMRMTANGLHIELQAERAETARLLACDHRMLAQTLEKSGFQEHGRISVAVIERAAHNMVHAGAAAAQTGDQAFGGNHPGGQETRPDSQAFGQGGRRFSDDSQKDFPFEDHRPDDLTRDDNAYHNSHRLII